MKNNALILLYCFLLVCCQVNKREKEIQVVSVIPANFKMYKTSEMAELMRTMLVRNDELRGKIINGEDIGDFDEEYLKIHTAKLTDVSQKDATYPTFAKHFEQMQKEIFLVDKPNRKEQFNSAINACVACHRDRCTGPIPRIKKLLIN